ncbi:MAG: anti-sigma factor family protein [Planctomycetota bacterium]|jgi:anti-sigma factor RsiW
MNDERLHAYLDNELAPEERSALEAELSADASLAAELEALRGVDRALDTLSGHMAPAGFTQDVLARVAAPRGRLLKLVLRVATAAAAILVAVMMTAPGHGPDASTAGNGFSVDEHLNYVWESDAETYGSMGLPDLEDQILEGLDET